MPLFPKELSPWECCLGRGLSVHITWGAHFAWFTVGNRSKKYNGSFNQCCAEQSPVRSLPTEHRSSVYFRWNTYRKGPEVPSPEVPLKLFYSLVSSRPDSLYSEKAKSVAKIVITHFLWNVTRYEQVLHNILHVNNSMLMYYYLNLIKHN
jgi:hypothetical protein